ncbi:fimbrial protein [Serratia sp. (in: enterobacteria)]|uniref:fimbrial protein n=1 Tax=Serratia sp. (in: enterobacteria) TaxID=616 RepID=UPI003988CAD8
MSLIAHCGKWAFVGVLIAQGSMPVQALTLNYSAQINQGTCQISLDKTQMHLGTVELSALRGTLVAAQPFTLRVRACSGEYQPGLTPAIKVTGEGLSRDGKWLFRSAADSVAQGIGIMLIKSDTPPSYGQKPVANGDFLDLAAKNIIPADTDLNFFAGMACGSVADCQAASVKPGRVSARIVFDFVYR